MSRSKQDILATESMLERLCRLLYAHRDLSKSDGHNLRTDAESLRRISMTLHRWHELECNGVVEVDEDTGRAFGVVGDARRRYSIPNREAGARKRLAAIMSRYPSLTAYVQGDPRGCALYILKPSDIPEGATVDSCYSRGLAVFR